MKDYQELIVWQKAMDLVAEIYRIVRLLPQTERYAIADQMRRAAVSIPSNIAEGFGRSTSKEYARFLSIARGSKYELDTQLLICIRIEYLQKKDVQYALSLSEEIGKMLNVMIGKLEQGVTTRYTSH